MGVSRSEPSARQPYDDNDMAPVSFNPARVWLRTHASGGYLVYASDVAECLTVSPLPLAAALQVATEYAMRSGAELVLTDGEQRGTPNDS